MGKYVTKLEIDDSDYLPKIRKAQEEINRQTQAARRANDENAKDMQKLDQLRSQAAQTARQAREAQIAALPVEAQLTRLQERQVRFQEALNRAIASGNTQRQETLRLAQSITNNEIATLRAQGVGGGSRFRSGLAALGTGAAGLLTGGGAAGLGGLLGGVAGGFIGGPGGALIGGTIGGGIGGIAGTQLGKARAQQNELIQMAQAIVDGAEKLQVSVEKYQEYSFAAKKSGADASALDTSFKTLTATQGAAAKASKEHQEAFKELGITLQDLKLSTPEQLFDRISEVAAKPMNLQQNAALLKVMGENAFNLAPAFRNGFAVARKEARDTGLVIEEELIRTLDEAGERMEHSSLRIRAALVPIAVETSKLSEQLVGYFANIVKAMGIYTELLRNGSGIGAAKAAAEKEFQNLQRLDAQQRVMFERELFRREKLAKIERAIATEKDPDRRTDLEGEAAILRNELGIIRQQAADALNAKIAGKTERLFEPDAMRRIGGFVGTIPKLPRAPRGQAMAEQMTMGKAWDAASGIIAGIAGNPLARLPNPYPQGTLTPAQVEQAKREIINVMTQAARSLTGIERNTEDLKNTLSEE